MKQLHEKTLVVIAGPTASGKTALSVELARHFNCEIISADSRQFYREMKIGTAIPDAESLNEIRHHFIGHLSIVDEYNVARYETEALQLLNSLFHNSNVVLCTGGSGLYIRALCDGMDDFPDADPELRESLNEIFRTKGIEALRSRLHTLDPDYYAVVDLANPKRLIRALEICIATGKPYSRQRTSIKKTRDFNIIKIAIERPRDELFERINRRTDQMMEDGLLDEVISLLPFRHLNALNTVGYKEIFTFLDKQCTLAESIEKIKTNTRRYAKRQMTWFNKEPGFQWLSPHKSVEVIRFIENAMKI